MSIVAGSIASDARRRRGRLTVREKIALCGEILAAYGRTRHVLVRYRVLPDALASLRSVEQLRTPEDPTALETGFRLGNAVTRTLAVLPTDSRCLMRSLVMITLLSRRGIAAELVIGVRTEDETFAAHAWVEYAGRPLLPPGADFLRLAEL